MKTISMSGSLRESVGKKDSKRLRNEGKVPCVLYGGEKQIHFAMETPQFKELIYSPEIAFIDLDIDGTMYKCIIQDVQYHVVSGNIMHADFLQIFEEKPIIMGVPVKTTGNSVGVIKGGVLTIVTRKLQVKALPVNMPENITLDVSKLDIGNSIKVSEVETKDFDMLDAQNAVVVSVQVTRAAASAASSAEDDEDGEGEGEGETESGSEE